MKVLGWLLFFAVLGPLVAGFGAVCFAVFLHFRPRILGSSVVPFLPLSWPWVPVQCIKVTKTKQWYPYHNTPKP